jgi:hypothetical protein
VSNEALSAAHPRAPERPTASELPLNLVCRTSGHLAGEPVVDYTATGSAQAVVSCIRCGAYIASFEGPLTAVLEATAHWVHRDGIQHSEPV